MSNAYFGKVKQQLEDLELEITQEDVEQTLFVVNDESRGINALMVDCEEELLVIEQMIFQISGDDASV